MNSASWPLTDFGWLRCRALACAGLRWHKSLGGVTLECGGPRVGLAVDTCIRLMHSISCRQRALDQNLLFQIHCCRVSGCSQGEYISVNPCHGGPNLYFGSYHASISEDDCQINGAEKVSSDFYGPLLSVYEKRRRGAARVKARVSETRGIVSMLQYSDDRPVDLFSPFRAYGGRHFKFEYPCYVIANPSLLLG